MAIFICKYAFLVPTRVMFMAQMGSGCQPVSHEIPLGAPHDSDNILSDTVPLGGCGRPTVPSTTVNPTDIYSQGFKPLGFPP